MAIALGKNCFESEAEIIAKWQESGGLSFLDSTLVNPVITLVIHPADANGMVAMDMGLGFCSYGDCSWIGEYYLGARQVANCDWATEQWTVLNMTSAQGVEVGIAMVGLLAVGFIFRALVQALRSDESSSET